ncbi:MAG TPA: hypothetical protein VKG22_08615 [Stellaceae bacterium]|nr:hypothetical protein [Stellaceae bacterium]
MSERRKRTGSEGVALLRDFVLILVPVLAGVGIGGACFHAFSSATITRSVLAFVTASGLALLFA